uniref:CHAT domain-containing protein n=1 Tax=Neobodo designis TaxID=312471 RepID=A0A6U4RII5_NEODS|eukprot:CAMPEP_0174827902 /NCGR_PEP_ID=MMETSP1114-20130205/997_1 /TAXON_ID=312471 /ORGANISM="Neobodo designis, Strain CCAP 1951/1" /LENGTH=989 /DNA_ID=CAMNT_0016061589 /DNA_START=24 /DNA_END=2993 /DNA_ORIENTATION=-
MAAMSQSQQLGQSQIGGSPAGFGAMSTMLSGPALSAGGGAMSQQRSVTAAALDKVKQAKSDMQHKQWNAALDSLNDALLIDSKLVQGFVLRSRVFYVLGQPESAITDAERALRLEPDNEEVLLQLAHLLMAEGQHAEALEMARAGLEISPTHEQLQHLEALLLFAANEFAAAARNAVSLLKSGETSMETLSSAATIFTSSVEALQAMGRANELADAEINVAYPSGEAAGHAHPEVQHFNAFRTAAHLVNQGQKFFDKGGNVNYERARYLWEAARLIYTVSGDHDNAAATINKLAHVYTALGRPDRAKAALAAKEKVSAVDTAEAWQNFKVGNYNAAIEGYEKALKEVDRLDFASVSKIRFNLGQVYLEASSVATAMSHFEAAAKTAEQAGDEGKELELRALNELAKCQVLQQEKRRAVESLEKARALHPEVYRTMGVVNAQESVRNEFLAAVKATHSTVGELALANGDYKSAFEWFERARSFSLVDELGEAVARDGMHDIVTEEVTEKLKEADAKLGLSYYRASSTQIHAFLVNAETGDVGYKAIGWAPHLQARPDFVCAEIRNSLEKPKPPLRPGDATVEDADAAAASPEEPSLSASVMASPALAASSSVLGPRRATRFRASTKAAESQMEASERRSAAAEAESKKHKDAVPEGRRNVTHDLFSAFITPFLPTIERLSAAARGPVRCVVSCDDSFSAVPWQALHDPHKDRAIGTLLNILAVSTCFAQFRRNYWRMGKKAADASGEKADIKFAVIRDESIPFGDKIAEAEPSLTVSANEQRLLQLQPEAFAPMRAVHVSLRFVNRDLLPEAWAKGETDASGGVAVTYSGTDSTLAARDWARTAVRENKDGFARCDDGWLFASKEKAQSPDFKNANFPVAFVDKSLAVSDVVALPLAGTIVTLDLEGGPRDCALESNRLVRNVLAAGATAVVVGQWFVPNEVRSEFFGAFYDAFRGQAAGDVFAAVGIARDAVKFLDRTTDEWATFNVFM